MTDVQPLTAEFANCWLCFKSRAECVVDQAPDPCLGFIEGVSNATCGHGQQFPYVQFADGSQINGEEAMRWFAKKGIGPFSQQAETIRELKAALADCLHRIGNTWNLYGVPIEEWSTLKEEVAQGIGGRSGGAYSWKLNWMAYKAGSDLLNRLDGAALTSTEAAAVEGEQEDDHFGFGCCGGYVDGVTNERMHRAECRS